MTTLWEERCDEGVGRAGLLELLSRVPQEQESPSDPTHPSFYFGQTETRMKPLRNSFVCRRALLSANYRSLLVAMFVRVCELQIE